MLDSSRSVASPTGEVAQTPLTLQAQLVGHKAVSRIRQLVAAATGYNLAGINLERNTAIGILATDTAGCSRIAHCIGSLDRNTSSSCTVSCNHTARVRHFTHHLKVASYIG